jgi:hypothetical protein
LLVGHLVHGGDLLPHERLFAVLSTHLALLPAEEQIDGSRPFGQLKLLLADAEEFHLPATLLFIPCGTVTGITQHRLGSLL